MCIRDRSWESVGAGTIAKSWNVLLGEKPHSVQKISASEDNESVLPLLKQIPGCEDATVEDVNERFTLCLLYTSRCV